MKFVIPNPTIGLEVNCPICGKITGNYYTCDRCFWKIPEEHKKADSLLVPYLIDCSLKLTNKERKQKLEAL